MPIIPRSFFPDRSSPRGIVLAGLLMVMLIFLAGCKPADAGASSIPEPPPENSLTYQGQGPADIVVEPWEGPAVLHLTAAEGSQPFRASAASGLDVQDLVRSETLVDEYRGMAAAEDAEMHLRIEGDRAWKVEVLPLAAKAFDTLEVPGTYSGDGNQVIAVHGDHSIARFDTSSDEHFSAWAIGEAGKWERLMITAEGDYMGNAVLPRNTTTIVVLASGRWSVNILEDCCKANPNHK